MRPIASHYHEKAYNGFNRTAVASMMALISKEDMIMNTCGNYDKSTIPQLSSMVLTNKIKVYTHP